MKISIKKQIREDLQFLNSSLEKDFTIPETMGEKYLTLKNGDTIKHGDEYLHNGEWLPMNSPERPYRSYYGQYRRHVSKLGSSQSLPCIPIFNN